MSLPGRLFKWNRAGQGLNIPSTTYARALKCLFVFGSTYFEENFLSSQREKNDTCMPHI